MRNLVLLVVLVLPLTSFAGNCKHFDKTQFLGYFNVVDYVCEGEDSERFSCYSDSDIYKNVSEVIITTIPLVVELGLKVEMMSHVDPLWPRLVEEFIFSEGSRMTNSKLSCSEYVENNESVVKIKSELSAGSSQFYSMLTKRNNLVELEIFGSINNVSSRKIFRLTDVN